MQKFHYPLLRLYLIILTLFFFFSSELYAQTFSWAKGISNSYGYGISVDDSGNTYVTGGFLGTVAFDTIQLISSGSLDIFLAKYDPIGNCIWAKKAGGINEDGSYSISVDLNGNSYVTGYFNGTVLFDTLQLLSYGGDDIFLAKYDPDGKCMWAKKAGGSFNDYGYFISVDGNGNSFITGEFKGTSIFGSIQLMAFGSDNQYDIYFAKYDSNGNCKWAKQAGGTHVDFGDRITIDAKGNSYMTGYFTGPADFGSVHLIGYGLYDIFVAKYDSNGNCIWAKQAGGTSGDGGTSIINDANGYSYVTGYFQGTALFDTTQLTSYGKADIFLAKYDPNGNCLWAKQAGGTGTDQGWGISIDANGNSYITGGFEVSATFNTIQLNAFGSEDIFTAKYNSNGNCLWAIKAGSVGWDVTQAIAVDSTGNSFITGNFAGTASFGTIQLSGGGAFISKIPANPVAVKNEIFPFPKEYYLEQNYPNPFNPITTINYSLPKAGYIRLTVYNTMGSKVANVVNEYKPAGNYSVQFKGSNLSSGIYFYKIEAEQFSQIKKMILLK